jgi:DNA modification methylase
MKNVLNYKIWKEWGKQTNHPTEKPEFLIGGLVEIFTNQNEIVLDSFAGGGTTGVASYKKWRHCISIEKEGGFIQMIENRQKRAEKNRGG